MLSIAHGSEQLECRFKALHWCLEISLVKSLRSRNVIEFMLKCGRVRFEQVIDNLGKSRVSTFINEHRAGRFEGNPSASSSGVAQRRPDSIA